MKKTGVIIILVVLLIASTYAEKADTTLSGKRPSVGLVLSGGGAKGFAYIGLLRVLNEVGLKVDYVGGTSIGSIVGGLYATGYHPDSIEKMIRQQDWDNLLTDVLERKYISYEEKEFGEKFVVTLPIKEKKIALRSSLYEGQEINLLLNRYFSPVYNVTDFNDLPIPFICIGTDLVTGKAIVLDEGNLAMAIRASMSIPGYFSPVDYKDHYLVDGGVINNYPALEVKEMGAEFIIGGDVQEGLHERDQLKTLTGIINQVITFNRTEANEQGYAVTDLYVPISTKPYGVMDFTEYDSIIAIGERVARAHYDEIKALADSLNALEFRAINEFNAAPLDSISIDNISYKGFNKIPVKYFGDIFDELKNSTIAVSDLENIVHSLSGTRFFDHVSYEIENKDGKSDLVIRAADGEVGYVSAGIHYDNDYRGSILINGAFRNLLGKRTKLFADLVLGTEPRFRALYLFDNGVKPGVGIKLDFYKFAFDTYEKDEKTNEIIFRNYKASLFYNQSLKNRINFRTGGDYEYFSFRQNIIQDSLLELFEDFSSYITLFVVFNADTRDRAFFSTKGFIAKARVEYVIPFSENWSQDLFTNSFIAYINYLQDVRLGKRFTLKPGLFVGTTLRQDDTPPIHHTFALGGLNPSNYVDKHIYFTGLRFLQSFGYHTYVARLKLQYNIFRKFYLTGQLDAGANEVNIEDIIKSENQALGYGLTVGYDSMIGPVGLTAMGSNLNSGLLWFLNVGFWF
jgi:NTE family protein